MATSHSLEKDRKSRLFIARGTPYFCLVNPTYIDLVADLLRSHEDNRCFFILLRLAGHMKFELDRIDHLAIPVANIADAVEWYRNTFSCSIAYEDNTWALLEFENVKLALVLPEQHPAHFAVERDDADSFGKLKLHRDETQSVYIEDPWTNNVEILQINKNE